MTRIWKQRFAVAVLAGGLALGVAACSDDNGGSVSTTTGGGGTESGIVIEGIAYPSSMTAAAGSTVTITNKDSVPHTVTADDGSFDVAVDPEGTAELTAPSEPGNYAVHCNVHPSMKGTLVVT